MSKKLDKLLYGSKCSDEDVNGKRHKSNSSDSSTCDSCSHTLSTFDDCSSTYYLNTTERCKSDMFHSSINLCAKNSVQCCVVMPNGCTSNGHFNTLHGNGRNKCKSVHSSYSSNTISRSSNLQPISLAKCSGEYHAECVLTRPSQPFSHQNSSPDSIKTSQSPSTTSLVGHCPISSDRESLFSHSSNGSSNSSSGCSLASTSLSCIDHNRIINQCSYCSTVQGSVETVGKSTEQQPCIHQDEPQPINHKVNDYSQCQCSNVVNKLTKEDIKDDEFINACQRKKTLASCGRQLLPIDACSKEVLFC